MNKISKNNLIAIMSKAASNAFGRSFIFAACMMSAVFVLSYILDIKTNDALANTVQSSFTTSLSTHGVDTVPPTVPTGLVANPVSSTQVDLTWDASTDLPPGVGSGVAGYRVFRDFVFIATTTSVTYSDIGLSPSTTYVYTVQAFDNQNNISDSSGAVSATTLAAATTTPMPSVPTGLSGSAVSTSEIDLNWTSSTEIPSGSGVNVAGYRVFRDLVFIATTTGTSYADTGLATSTTYSYTVQAFDDQLGMSASSDAFSATTLASATSTPTPVPTATNVPIFGGVGSQATNPVPSLVVPNISDISIIPDLNKATVSFSTDLPTQARLYWGMSPDHEIGSLSSLFYGTSHEVALIGLSPATHYFVRIEVSSNQGVTVSAESEFTTISPAVSTPMPNRVGFSARPLTTSVFLSWQNPADSRFAASRIIRSDRFFPKDPFDGVPIYEGAGQSFYDRDVEQGHTYYYSIFAKGTDGLFSSGALAQARVPVAGEAFQNIFVDPFADLPESAIVDPMIGALTISDLEFIQDDRSLPNDGIDSVEVDGGKDLTISLSYSKVPLVLKTIAITIVDANDPKKIFPFLLRINSAKTAYEATIAAFGKPGLYPIRVSILDFDNLGLKRLNGNMHVFASMAVENNLKRNDPLGILWLVLIALLELLAGLVRKKKSDREKIGSKETDKNKK